MKVTLFSKLVLDHPLEEAMRLAAEAGYDGIELVGARPHLTADIEPGRLQAVKRLSTDLGLPIVNIPAYVGRYVEVDEEEARKRLEQFKQYIHMADTLGCRYVRHLPSNIAPERATDRDWEMEMAWCRQAAAYAARYGVSLILEMHGGSLIATADSTGKYLEMAGVSNLAVTYDVGNIYLAGAPYGPEELKKVERYVRIIHVRDHGPWGAAGRPASTFMGEGVIDYGPILRRLLEIGFDGYLSAECELFARATAAQIGYKVPTTDLSSAEIIKREGRAIRALRDRAIGS